MIEALPWPLGPALDFAAQEAVKVSEEKLNIARYLVKRKVFTLSQQQLCELEDRLFRVYIRLARAKTIRLDVIGRAYEHAEIIRDYRLQRFGKR